MPVQNVLMCFLSNQAQTIVRAVVDTTKNTACLRPLVGNAGSCWNGPENSLTEAHARPGMAAPKTKPKTIFVTCFIIVPPVFGELSP